MRPDLQRFPNPVAKGEFLALWKEIMREKENIERVANECTARVYPGKDAVLRVKRAIFDEADDLFDVQVLENAPNFYSCVSSHLGDKIKCGEFFEPIMKMSLTVGLLSVLRFKFAVKFPCGGQNFTWICCDSYDNSVVESGHLKLVLRKETFYYSLPGDVLLRKLHCYFDQGAFYINTHINADIRERVNLVLS